MAQRYRLLKDVIRNGQLCASKGDVVYEQREPEACARDTDRHGTQHIAVSLSDGLIPPEIFTVPVDEVEPLDAPYDNSGERTAAPNLFSAFRTTVSSDGKYEMVFRFKSMEAMHAADDEWRRLRNEKLGRNPHPVLETEKLVSKFADALLAKLAMAETKYGYNNEWLTADWEAVCKSELARHVAKGDPLDVAAYAAFCWARGWTTAPSPELAESQEEQPS